jgi:hypothetical protein
MTFLNPAVLIGLLAASIPVIIHLLNLRKLKRIDFSTLSFLKELQKNKIRKIKIKQWFLLALRVMIILMLVLAFSRPALRGTTIAGMASSAKTTAVFILDDTFSMSVIGNKGSYFNNARETIKQLLGELQEGDEAALILVSEKQSEIKATTNLTELSKRVDDAGISYASGYIHDAVARGAGIISESQNFNKEIYLLSDLQENRIAARQSLSDFSEIFNENVKFYLINFSGERSIYNLAVTDFKLQTQIFEKDKPVSFDVTLANYSNEDVDDAVISLFMNGERSSQRSVDLASGTAVTLSMEVDLKETGYIEFAAEIEDDEILQDNRRYLSIYVPDEIPVSIFYENENDIRFIDIALRAAGENNPLRISRRNISQLSSVNLSSSKTVIISAAGNVKGIERLKAFADNGGGVLLFPSSSATPESWNSLLTSMSLPAAVSASGMKGETSVINRFSNVDFDHPLFKNIFLNERKKIESPEIYYNFNIRPSGKGMNIITLSDGSVFMAEYSSGEGRIIAFNSLPVLSWNNLPLKGIFPPLIYQSTLYLSYKRNGEEGYIAGNPVVISLTGRSIPQIRINKPDGASETVNLRGQDYLQYSAAGTAGIYTLSFNNEVIEKFEVNTDPAESIISYITEGDFKDYLNNIGFSGSFASINPENNISEEILQARFGSELWKIFAVLTLLLAITEMTVARTMRKELAVIK